eukprot:366569-Chlamydomonas_euryale.AAC.29
MSWHDVADRPDADKVAPGRFPDAGRRWAVHHLGAHRDGGAQSASAQQPPCDREAKEGYGKVHPLSKLLTFHTRSNPLWRSGQSGRAPQSPPRDRPSLPLPPRPGSLLPQRLEPRVGDGRVSEKSRL